MSMAGGRNRRRKAQLYPPPDPYDQFVHQPAQFDGSQFFPPDAVAAPKPGTFLPGFNVELPDLNQQGDNKQADEDASLSSVRHRAVFVTSRDGRVLHKTNDDKAIQIATYQEMAGLVFDIVTVFVCLPRENDEYGHEKYIDYRYMPLPVDETEGSGQPDPKATEDTVVPEPGTLPLPAEKPLPAKARKKKTAPRRKAFSSSVPIGAPLFDHTTLERMNVLVESMRGTRRLDIHSPPVLHAIRSIVKYWPGVHLASPCLELYEPHALLVHNASELDVYARTHPHANDQDVCEQEKDAAKHLDLVRGYLDDNIMPAVTAERARHARGFATFEYLWLLFKPGADVVVTITDPLSRSIAPYRRGYVVESVGIHQGLYGKRSQSACTIRLWGLQYDGTSIGRVSHEVVVTRFDGEMEVSTMHIVPANWPSHTVGGKPWAEVLTANGKAAYDLSRPQCLQHTGKAKEFPYNVVEGLVMVDTKTFYTDNPYERPRLKPKETKASAVVDCYCTVCEKTSRQGTQPNLTRDDPFAGYDEIGVDASSFTKHQSFLFPSRVYAFHFRTRAWELVDVENLGPAKFQEDILDTLVMQPERIKMLKALSKNYMRSKEDKHERHTGFWSADFIGGKGKSQIILLHGKPGVGKTYTAECIAEHTKRPLMSLTCADIGTGPEEVEANLEYHFTAARDWGAFVLIDEADVYMEVRIQLWPVENPCKKPRRLTNCRDVRATISNETASWQASCDLSSRMKACYS